MNPSTPSFYAILHTPPLLDASDSRLVSLSQSIFQLAHSTDQTNHIYKDQSQQLAHYLNQHDHVNQHSLQLLFKFLIQEETKWKPLVYSFRQVIMDYLMERLDQVGWKTSCTWILCFLHKVCLGFIHYQDKVKLLSRCFKLRSTIGYDDLEQYHVLYNLQNDLHLPSCVWEEEILVNCQDKQTTCQLDPIFDHIIAIPYPETISLMMKIWVETLPATQPLPSSIQTRLKLYGATYPLEMKGFFQSLTSKGYCLPKILSPGLAEMLTQISLSPLPLELFKMVSDMAYGMQGTSISLDAVLLENIRSTVDVQMVDDGALKECALILQESPPTRFMPHLTLLLIKMAKPRLTLCLPNWVTAIALKVDDTVYVKDRANPAVYQLTCLVLYFVVFCQCHPTMNSCKSEFEKIWNHYSLQRSLYTQSVPTSGHDDILPLVKNLLTICQR